MKKVLIAFALVGLLSCGGAGSVDQSSPEGTAQAIFDAAANDDMSLLKGLCDPEGDGDSKKVCECAESDVDAKHLESFKEYFSKGKVVSSEEDGDKAEVKIKFGPDGDKDETFKMVKKDGKWLLSSF